MKNQVLLGTPTSPRFAACPITVLAGDPVLIGKIPAVALNNYNADTGGTTFYVNGTFLLTVIGRSSESPVVTAGIKPGDNIYAVGTLDATTNVTTGLTLDANSSSGTLFGKLDPQVGTAITAGSTDTACAVRLGDN
jgi:hypothetical protein